MYKLSDKICMAHSLRRPRSRIMYYRHCHSRMKRIRSEKHGALLINSGKLNPTISINLTSAMNSVSALRNMIMRHNAAAYPRPSPYTVTSQSFWLRSLVMLAFKPGPDISKRTDAENEREKKRRRRRTGGSNGTCGVTQIFRMLPPAPWIDARRSCARSCAFFARYTATKIVNVGQIGTAIIRHWLQRRGSGVFLITQWREGWTVVAARRAWRQAD